MKNEELAQRQADRAYDIPRFTLKIELKSLCEELVCRVFNENEEALLAARLILCVKFDVPLEDADIQMIVKNYLKNMN